MVGLDPTISETSLGVWRLSGRSFAAPEDDALDHRAGYRIQLGV